MAGKSQTREVWGQRDIRVIYAAAFLRSVGVGLAGVVLGIYLARRGMQPGRIGVVLGAGLAGASLSTLISSLRADRLGRQRTLVALSLLAALAGAGLALTANFRALVAIAFLGTLNGMGTDRGAAFALEQAILPQCVASGQRTLVLSWYNLVLDGGHALGALAAVLPVALGRLGIDILRAYKGTFIAFAVCNLASGGLYLLLSSRVEASAVMAGVQGWLRSVSPQSKRVIARLGALSGLDALGGGLLTDAIVSFWFFARFGVSEAWLGPIFFTAHLLNAASYLGAERLARRFGLLHTMVFTHIPSSIFLLTVPLAPTFPAAVALFLARESLVEMDVPTRQSYIAAIVEPQERVLASGAANLTRNISWAAASSAAGYFMQYLALASPLVIGGSMKICYDVLLYRGFHKLKPPEEQQGASAAVISKR
jgi:predicted MFS family arabinose efflux permease